VRDAPAVSLVESCAGGRYCAVGRGPARAGIRQFEHEFACSEFRMACARI